MDCKTLLLTLMLALTFSARTNAQVSDGDTVATEPSPASSIDATRFGKKGRSLLAGSLDGHWTGAAHGTEDWGISLLPSLAHFVHDFVAVGLMPGYSAGSEVLGSAQGVRFQELSLSVYALWQVRLAERLSWLVMPSIGYAYHWHKSDVEQLFWGLLGPIDDSYYIDRKQHHFRFALHLPVVYHLSNNVVAGLGPYFQFEKIFQNHSVKGSEEGNPVTVDFSSDQPRSTLGVSSFIGATF